MSPSTKSPHLPPVPVCITSCSPYPPGKPVEELERELGITNSIKLASNENPLGASPKALQAMQRNVTDVHLYPDAGHYYLRKALAKHHGLNEEEFLVGNGSNEVIELLVRTYCVPGDNIISCPYAFIAYRISATVHGVEYRDPESDSDLSIDIDAMLALVDEKTRIIFLPNPNNPTGGYVKSDAIKALLDMAAKRNILVVLDYAYWEYVTADDLPDAMPFLHDYKNVIVLRTFSKIHGLSGLRVGYGMANTEIWQQVLTVKMPFNVNSLALVAAEAAIFDIEHIKLSYEMNAQGLRYLEKELPALGIETYPSQGNFVLAKFSTDPIVVYERLLQQGVIVRPVKGYGLAEHLRLSVGTQEQNERLVDALKKCQ